MRVVVQAALHALAGSERLRTLATRLGLGPDSRLARRFVAGETTGDAIGVARTLAAAGLAQTFEHLGEEVRTMVAADRATRAYLDVLHEIAQADVDRHVTVVPTRFGLLVDRATCVDNLRRVLDRASAHDFFVRIAMEDSGLTQPTFDVFDTLWQQDYRSAGLVIQASLPRSLEDARRLSRLGAGIRLVKGAYAGPRGVAYRTRAEIRTAFREIMQLLLLEARSPAIATHDEALVEETRTFAARHRIPPDHFEFQMYYGVRPDLQAALARSGYRVRVCVPFGREWFPYLLRRIGARVP